jgi:hypothetical protein
MREKQIEQTRRLFEFAGTLVCALFLGYLLWRFTLPSAGQVTVRDRLNLIWYLLLSSSCYLAAFKLLHRCRNLPLRWAIICFLGTTLSSVINHAPLYWTPGAIARRELLAISLSSVYILNIVMLAIMTSIWSVGFLIRLAMKSADEKVITLKRD